MYSDVFRYIRVRGVLSDLTGLEPMQQSGFAVANRLADLDERRSHALRAPISKRARTPRPDTVLPRHRPFWALVCSNFLGDSRAHRILLEASLRCDLRALQCRRTRRDGRLDSTARIGVLLVGKHCVRRLMMISQIGAVITEGTHCHDPPSSW